MTPTYPEEESKMSEKRLVAISGEQVERIRKRADHLKVCSGPAAREDEYLLRSIVTAYSEGITEAEGQIAVDEFDTDAMLPRRDEDEAWWNAWEKFRSALESTTEET